jgi:hypothetical protein
LNAVLEGILLAEIATSCSGPEVNDSAGARFDPGAATSIYREIGVVESGDVGGDVHRESPESRVGHRAFHWKSISHRPPAEERGGELEWKVRERRDGEGV